jgi:deoxyhypusine synthase
VRISPENTERIGNIINGGEKFNDVLTRLLDCFDKADEANLNYSKNENYNVQKASPENMERIGNIINDGEKFNDVLKRLLDRFYEVRSRKSR